MLGAKTPPVHNPDRVGKDLELEDEIKF